MDENVQTNATVGETQDNATASVEKKQETESRTFTQQEVDEIVTKRLNKERSKYADYSELKTQLSDYEQAKEKAGKVDELQAQINQLNEANKIREMREKVSSETKVPLNLLNGKTEKECQEQAKNILAFARGNAYPNIKDGGEIANAHSRGTKEQFTEWFKEQMKK
ncbi:hypothetical protein [Ureaplasma parvum]|uniref:hypothetical protein n=1 Tax=Ureaplasma parvum TaxID=134821 RepID=UPI0026EEC621|nr:hypothetical protein [Ureaplasma parvum]